MADKIKALELSNGDWKITRTNGKGEESTTDTVHSIERMPDGEAINVYLGLVKEAPNKRRASASLQCSIMALSIDKLIEYKGTGDVKTGQLSNGLREVFRKAEDKFFEQFMEKTHPDHKTFLGRLPKINERGDSLEKDTDGKALPIGERFAYFVTATRKDPSYAAAKNLVLSFFAFVGNLPYDEKTGNIVPPEAMRVMVQNAKDVTPPDNSWEAKITGLIRELILPDNPEKPLTIKDEKLPSLVQMARDLVNELTRLEKLAAERATKRAKPGDVVTQTQDAMNKANAKREGAPSDAVTKGKATEPQT